MLPKNYNSIQDCHKYHKEEIIFTKPNKTIKNNKLKSTLETIDLLVPSYEYEQFKNLGAQWDSDKNTWYAFKTDDYLKFHKWIQKDPKEEKRKKILAKFLSKK